MDRHLVRDALASPHKPILFDHDRLRVEGQTATNVYWAQFARRGDRCFIQPSRWMLPSGLICTGFVACVFIAAGWAVKQWMPEPGEMLFWLTVIGIFTVSVMLALLIGTCLVLGKRGPWLTADLDTQIISGRLADRSWPIAEVEGVVVIDGPKSFGDTRYRMQEVKLIAEGKPFHVYSQAHNLTRSVLKPARRFAEATGLPPVEFIKLSGKPQGSSGETETMTKEV